MNTDRFLTRVYDKQEKKMLYQGCAFEIQVDGGVGCYNVLGIAPHGITFDCFTVDGDNAHYTSKFGDRFIPMQCAGLKDNNDKLIYEGDVLQEDDWKEEGEIYKLHPVVVIYIDNRLDAQELTPEGSIRGIVPSKECKVIGNRWEHPELLEENK